jgi:mono/diheme cytochrome c family protein
MKRKLKTQARWTQPVVLSLLIGIASTSCWSGELEGELLYSTHCLACHTEQVHWRQNSLVKDWTTLRTQIERWQTNIGQKWTREQISDVAKYLNTSFYKLAPADQALLKKKQ